MRVLVYTRAFLPNIGGLETAVHGIATELVKLGNTVTVVTPVSGESDRHDYAVVRTAQQWPLFRIAKCSDVCLVAGLTVRGLGAITLAGKPVVVMHHTRYSDDRGQLIVKRLMSRFYSNVYCSHSLNAHLGVTGRVIPNMLPSDFCGIDASGQKRTKDIAFVGRLVPDKGVSHLFHAIALLKASGTVAGCSVIGEGPELQPLLQTAHELNIADQINFLGALRGLELRRALQEHRILAVPSVWEEPFGIVAIEGIAAGCIVVATSKGGLPEAVGPCGIIVDAGLPLAMANGLKQALSAPAETNMWTQRAREHLQQFCPSRVGQQYDEALRAACIH